MLQAAGAAGQLAGIKGFENFGKDPKDDTNNCAAAPRRWPTTCAATART